MTVRYVRSTDGSDADNGTTWALAKATLTGLAAIDTAGDSLYVSQVHAETTAAAISFAWAGSQASPSRLVCGNDGAAPPTAVAATATVTTTGNSNITCCSAATQYVYFYGLGFVAGSGASGTATISTMGQNVFDNCSFFLASTGTSSVLELSSSAGAVSRFLNCGFKFSASAQGFNLNNQGRINITGGSLLAGGTSPANLLVAYAAGSNLRLDGFDLTNAGSSINIVAAGGTTNFTFSMRDCRLPSSWSGALHGGTPGNGTILEMFNCDSGDTHYRYRKATAAGTIADETTLVRTGGASDGTTTYSLKLVSGTNAVYPMETLDTPEMVKWNDTTGSSITVTVEFLRDSASNLTDADIWVEVLYLGTSGVPLASFISDCTADVVTTAAAQAASSTTWTTTGMSNPNKQKCNVTFTPQEAGFIHATVRLAKASTTVYVDPKITVT